MHWLPKSVKKKHKYILHEMILSFSLKIYQSNILVQILNIATIALSIDYISYFCDASIHTVI